MAYANKTIRNPITGQSIQFIKTSKDTGGVLLEMAATFNAQSKAPAPHYHPHQAEDFTILSGELMVQINGQQKIVRQGDTFHIPKNTIHSMWNPSGKEAIVNWKVRPALDTEYLFETATGLATDGKTDTVGRPPFLQSVLIAKRFSNVYRLPKPGFVIQQIVFTLLTPLAYLLGYRPTYEKYLN